MRDITELENVKAELAATAEAAELAKLKAELAKLKAELAEATQQTREANNAAATARRQTRAMGARALTIEQLRPAILPNGPLNPANGGAWSSAELSSFSRPWRRLLVMMRAPKLSTARLTAEGLLRQLDVWYEDIGPKREWFSNAAFDMQMEKGAKQSTDQAKHRPSQPAATLESGSTTSTGAKVW